MSVECIKNYTVGCIYRFAPQARFFKAFVKKIARRRRAKFLNSC